MIIFIFFYIVHETLLVCSATVRSKLIMNLVKNSLAFWCYKGTSNVLKIGSVPIRRVTDSKSPKLDVKQNLCLSSKKLNVKISIFLAINEI